MPDAGEQQQAGSVMRRHGENEPDTETKNWRTAQKEFCSRISLIEMEASSAIDACSQLEPNRISNARCLAQRY